MAIAIAHHVVWSEHTTPHVMTMYTLARSRIMSSHYMTIHQAEKACNDCMSHVNVPCGKRMCKQHPAIVIPHGEGTHRLSLELKAYMARACPISYRCPNNQATMVAPLQACKSLHIALHQVGIHKIYKNPSHIHVCGIVFSSLAFYHQQHEIITNTMLEHQ